MLIYCMTPLGPFEDSKKVRFRDLDRVVCRITFQVERIFDPVYVY